MWRRLYKCLWNGCKVNALVRDGDVESHVWINAHTLMCPTHFLYAYAIVRSLSRFKKKWFRLIGSTNAINYKWNWPPLVRTVRDDKTMNVGVKEKENAWEKSSCKSMQCASAKTAFFLRFRFAIFHSLGFNANATFCFSSRALFNFYTHSTERLRFRDVHQSGWRACVARNIACAWWTEKNTNNINIDTHGNTWNRFSMLI